MSKVNLSSVPLMYFIRIYVQNRDTEVITSNLEVRSYAVMSINSCKKRKAVMYGTANPKKRKV